MLAIVQAGVFMPQKMKKLNIYSIYNGLFTDLPLFLYLSEYVPIREDVNPIPDQGDAKIPSFSIRKGILSVFLKMRKVKQNM